jgi:hypothetical protein
MIAAYAADEKTIDRDTIIEVAENLDMLPSEIPFGQEHNISRNDELGRVLTPIGRAELINDYEPIMKNSNFDESEIDSTPRGSSEG